MSTWFIIPHHAKSDKDLHYLSEMISSLLSQSEPDWFAVIIDDNSPVYNSIEEGIEERLPHQLVDERLHFIKNKLDRGVSSARNIGIQYASMHGAEVILFQDDDDIAHPDRVKATHKVIEDIRYEDFILSTTFTGIDYLSKPVAQAKFRTDMLDVAEQQSRYTPLGCDTYLEMIQECGYIFPTSGTAVNVGLALKYPFPKVVVSEDHITWMNMVASGAYVQILDEIPFQYRFKDNEKHRTKTFIINKFSNDIEGFVMSMQLYIDRFGRDFDIIRVIENFLLRLKNCLFLQNFRVLTKPADFQRMVVRINERLR
jgi:glycosyltransferase involved in cell wall biosynthesis